MIFLLLGAPGGGKSYEAVVHHVLPALQCGRKVITNLPLDLERFKQIDPAFPGLIEVRTVSSPARGQWVPGGEGSAFKVAKVPTQADITRRPFSGVWDYYDEWQHPKDGTGPLYVIDECHLAMPRGSTDRQVEEWFSLHRHFRCDVLLITQSYGKVSRAIVDLVQVVYRVRKNVALGSSNSYTRKVQDGVRGEVVNTAIRRYEAKYFGLYRSHTQTGAGREAMASDVRPLWRHWSFMGALFCFVVVAVALASGKVQSPVAVPADAKLSVQPKAKADPPPVAQLPASAPGKPVQGPASGAQVGPQKPVNLEPFAGRGLHITGLMQMGARVVYTFSLSQNGQHIAALTDADIRAAGYEWRPTGHCHGEMVFAGNARPVICDAPQISLTPPGVAPSQRAAPDSEGGARPAGGPPSQA